MERDGDAVALMRSRLDGADPMLRVVDVLGGDTVVVAVVDRGGRVFHCVMRLPPGACACDGDADRDGACDGEASDFDCDCFLPTDAGACAAPSSLEAARAARDRLVRRITGNRVRTEGSGCQKSARRAIREALARDVYFLHAEGAEEQGAAIDGAATPVDDDGRAVLLNWRARVGSAP
jgi:hypothetical protein